MSNFVIVLSEILGPDYTMRVRVEFFHGGRRGGGNNCKAKEEKQLS